MAFERSGYSQLNYFVPPNFCDSLVKVPSLIKTKILTIEMTDPINNAPKKTIGEIIHSILKDSE